LCFGHEKSPLRWTARAFAKLGERKLGLPARINLSSNHKRTARDIPAISLLALLALVGHIVFHHSYLAH
jgi:hypothetical protein